MHDVVFCWSWTTTAKQPRQLSTDGERSRVTKNNVLINTNVMVYNLSIRHMLKERLAWKTSHHIELHKGHQMETKQNDSNKKKYLRQYLTDYAKSYKIGCALRGTSHAAWRLKCWKCERECVREMANWSCLWRSLVVDFS